MRRADEVPERARFADTPGGRVPVVKVVATDRGPTMREIVEYGPNDQRLRSTVMMRKPG